MFFYLKAGLLSFFLSLALTYLIIYISRRKNILLSPTSERWHKKPTPSLGGIAVFITFTGVCLIFCKNPSHVLPILGGGTLIFGLGLADDIFKIKPYTRLIAEIGVACIMILSGIHIIFHSNPIIFFPLTVLWIVGITNAFNLLDNMDGLSPGIGAIASIFLFLISVKLGLSELLAPSLAMACILIAFLIFNFNPAKIFLGDCGALYIGFILATLSIKGTWHQASNLFLMLLTPLLILGIPIFDTFFVAVQRKLHGLPASQGGKDHSSHRLVMLGWSEKKAAVFLYITAAILGAIAIIGLDYNVYVKSVVFAIALITVILFGIFLAQTKVYGKNISAVKTNGRTKMITNILYKRRMLDILIDSSLIIIAYISAYLIKYDGQISSYNLDLINKSLPIILIVKLSSFYLSGLYKGVWKYIDFDDATKILKGVLLGSAASIVILVGFTRFSGYSRTVFVIDIVLLLFLVTGSRLVLRMFRESFYAYSKIGKKILLFGAGEGGKLVLNEIRKSRKMNVNPIGIIDDDESKHGKKLLGLPVLGGRDKIASIVQEKEIEKILIAVPSAEEKEINDIVLKCKEAHADYSVMKSFDELF